MDSAPVAAGDVHLIDECDYQYGWGTLRLRVCLTRQIEVYPDAAWIRVTGMEVRVDGTPIGPRTVLVRVAALKGK